MDFFHLRQFLTNLGLFCSLDCSQGTYELLNNCVYSSLSDKIWTISLQFPSSSSFIRAAILITPLFPEFVSDNFSKSLTVLTSLNILTIRLNLIYSLLFPNLSTVSIHLKNYMYYLPNQNSLIFQKGWGRIEYHCFLWHLLLFFHPLSSCFFSNSGILLPSLCFATYFATQHF